MNEIDMNSLNTSIFQARKQVEEKLCELPALKAVFKNYILKIAWNEYFDT